MQPLARALTAFLLTTVWLVAAVAPVLAGEPSPDVPEEVVIHGLVVDEHDDALPLASGTATVTYPGGSAEDVPLVLSAETGEFTITLQGWADPGATLVTIDILGEERRADDPDSDCELRIVDTATASIELATPDATEVLIVATADEVGTICPSPAPASERPTVTTPPTDGLGSPAVRPGAPVALSVLAMVLIAALTAVLTTRLVSRRGS